MFDMTFIKIIDLRHSKQTKNISDVKQATNK